jgi:hypothetical protein
MVYDAPNAMGFGAVGGVDTSAISRATTAKVNAPQSEMHPIPTIRPSYYSHALPKLPTPDTIQCSGRVEARAPNCDCRKSGERLSRNTAIEICYPRQNDRFSLTWNLDVLAFTLRLKH